MIALTAYGFTPAKFASTASNEADGGVSGEAISGSGEWQNVVVDVKHGIGLAASCLSQQSETVP